jgi:hypothetical protein
LWLLPLLLTPQALAAIDWRVYITIAMAFGVSAALEKSKVAAAIASAFVTISEYHIHIITQCSSTAPAAQAVHALLSRHCCWHFCCKRLHQQLLLPSSVLVIHHTT